MTPRGVGREVVNGRREERERVRVKKKERESMAGLAWLG